MFSVHSNGKARIPVNERVLLSKRASIIIIKERQIENGKRKAAP